MPGTAHAGVFDGWALGVGINRATSNDLEEEFAVSLKWRDVAWEAGLDYLSTEPRPEESRAGEGPTEFMFAWGAWLIDFDRPEWQDYGIFAGAGAGVVIDDGDIIDSPLGPFIMLGWDFSTQAGLEGKVGYFGENIFGTAMFYWYFE